MSKEYQKLKNIWHDIASLFPPDNAEVDSSIIKRQLSSVYFPGPSFYYIFDFSTFKIQYISPEIESFLSYNPKNFSLEKLMGLIHPDDKEFFFTSINLMGKFFTDFLPIKDKLFYKVSFHIRVKDLNGKYKLFLDQHMALTLNEAGNPSKSIVSYSDISNIVEDNLHNLSFTDTRGLKSYSNVKSEEDFNRSIFTESLFSLREIDVIKLIAEGLNSKDISKRLGISTETIRTHRNNILKKSGFNKITKVVSYSIREGLI